MNTQYKSALVTATLAVALAACSGQSDNAASGASQAPGTPQSQSAATQSAPAQVTAAQGAVERNYPSAVQETAMKFNYSIYQQYGKDAARITAFFPGTSKQPVSVKLAPNTAGYALTSEGNECKFPLEYDLTSIDGRQLASGEYKQQPVTLTGWDTQTGSAILTIRMADGAQNNYGCNLVVTKE